MKTDVIFQTFHPGEVLPKADIHSFHRDGKTNLRVLREEASLNQTGKYGYIVGSTLLHMHASGAKCEEFHHEFYPRVKQSEEV